MSTTADNKKAIRALLKGVKIVKELLNEKDKEIAQAKKNELFWQTEHDKREQLYKDALFVEVQTQHHRGRNIKACKLELDTDCAKFGPDLEKLVFIVAQELIRQINLGK